MTLEDFALQGVLVRIAQNLGDRVGGPLTLRLLLQPTVATVLAIRAGLRDAKLGKSPYFWALVTDRSHRSEMLSDGWKSVSKVFFFAIALDVIYQIMVLHFVYPGEALIVAFVLAIAPYLIFRGLVTRLVSNHGPSDWPTSHPTTPAGHSRYPN